MGALPPQVPSEVDFTEHRSLPAAVRGTNSNPVGFPFRNDCFIVFGRNSPEIYVYNAKIDRWKIFGVTPELWASHTIQQIRYICIYVYIRYMRTCMHAHRHRNGKKWYVVSFAGIPHHLSGFEMKPGMTEVTESDWVINHATAESAEVGRGVRSAAVLDRTHGVFTGGTVDKRGITVIRWDNESGMPIVVFAQRGYFTDYHWVKPPWIYHGMFTIDRKSVLCFMHNFAVEVTVEPIKGRGVELSQKTMELEFPYYTLAFPYYKLLCFGIADDFMGGGYVLGGVINKTDSDSIFSLEKKRGEDKWTLRKIGTLPYAIYGCSAITIGDNVHILGGQSKIEHWDTHISFKVCCVWLLNWIFNIYQQRLKPIGKSKIVLLINNYAREYSLLIPKDLSQCIYRFL